MDDDTESVNMGGAVDGTVNALQPPTRASVAELFDGISHIVEAVEGVVAHVRRTNSVDPTSVTAVTASELKTLTTDEGHTQATPQNSSVKQPFLQAALRAKGKPPLLVQPLLDGGSVVTLVSSSLVEMLGG